ncbi:MAG: ATP-dependent DNA helicase RecG [Bacteroidota bacterium]|nr:ATP-dependent DNA helicase RecG [Bacteroidota bacterium]
MKSQHHTIKDLAMPVQYVKGIGPKRANVLAEHGIKTVRDLIYYFPYDYLDLSKVEKVGNLLASMDSDRWITTMGTIRSFELIGRQPRQRLVVVLGDETGTIQLVFFQSVQYFKKAFTLGETIAVSGKVTSFKNCFQIVHPSIDRLSSGGEDDEDSQGLHTGGIVPKYGSSAELRDVNLHVKGFRRIIKSALDDFIDVFEEHLPKNLLERNKFLPIKLALRSIHYPESFEILSKAQHRLKFDELFIMQLLLALRRKSVKSEMPGISFNVKSMLARQLVDSLPFKLTKSQVNVIKEIAEDMESRKPMNRLLQGDVGSGKTIVALLAMLVAVDNGYQAALMAPTEILAEQHYKTLKNFLQDMPVNIRLLIGGQRSKLRREILEDINQGSSQIIVGTHALIQENVKFTKLGFVVIDEQHRFGVAQRVALREKGINLQNGSLNPDILVMTATPIPRTLSLTLYGDLDVSVINEMPLNRKPIKTILRTSSQVDKVYTFVREQVHGGRQVYIVYPLIDESEKMDLKAATESYEKLKTEIFSDLKLGLLHGRMSSIEKDEVMSAFKSGVIKILVATTVIEVGIDIPNASMMVIEHAERFGLAQLHQLRGRVGRGAAQSYCILIAPDWIEKIVSKAITLPTIDDDIVEKQKAIRRLQTIVETVDGFKIAEIDLELRGPGDFFGTRQSGLPQLQLANLMTDGDILALARQEAFQLVEIDPYLRLSEHEPLRSYYEERMKESLTLLQGG